MNTRAFVRLRRRDIAVVMTATLVAAGPLPKFVVFAPQLGCLFLLPWSMPALMRSVWGRLLAGLVLFAGAGYAAAVLATGSGGGGSLVAVARDLILVATVAAVLWRQRTVGDAATFVTAAFIGAVVYGLWAKSGSGLDSLWKFGIGEPIALLGVVILGARRAASYVWLALVALLSVALDFRTLALVAALAGAAFLVRGQRRSTLKTAAVAALAVVVLGSLATGYDQAVGRGWLGHAAEVRYEAQHQHATTFAPLGLLGVSRATTFINAALVVEHPLLGAGVHPKLSNSALKRAGRWERAAGVEQTASDNVATWRLLAEHSLLFEAWIEGGLFAALFFLFVLFAVLPRSWWSAWRRDRLAPFAVTSAVLSAWDILFSPNAPVTLLTLGLAAGLAVTLATSAPDASEPAGARRLHSDTVMHAG